MQPKYEYKRLPGGVYLIVLRDGKFKSDTITVRFLTEYSRENAAALALIPAVVSSCNSQYPTGKEFSKKLSALYGTTVSGFSDQKGNIYEIALAVDYLDDRYALNGESISEEAFKLLLGCIFSPAVENGGFAPAEFEMRRNDLLDAVDGEINDKVSYALNLAYETVYRGEPSAEKYYGSREDVESITPQRTYEVYMDLLKNARIEISFCGCGEFEKLMPMLKAFEGFGTESCPDFVSFSRCKPGVEYVSKSISCSQANMVIAFKSGIRDVYGAQVMSAIYGGAPFSKLFANVREKLSLCYFCSAMYSESKGTMFVVSAVEERNIELARNEIIRQLSLIAAGDFSDEEISDAKLMLTSKAKAVGDRISSLEGWYNMGLRRGEILSPMEYADKLNAVGRDDIMAIAGDMRIDTVFVLKNGGEPDEI